MIIWRRLSTFHKVKGFHLNKCSSAGSIQRRVSFLTFNLLIREALQEVAFVDREIVLDLVHHR